MTKSEREILLEEALKDVAYWLNRTSHNGVGNVKIYEALEKARAAFAYPKRHRPKTRGYD